MIRAEDVGRAKPFQFREALHRVLGQGALGDLGHARADGDQYIGLLRFRGVLSTGAQEARQVSGAQVGVGGFTLSGSDGHRGLIFLGYDGRLVRKVL